jgi:MFS transporter, OCT family, solute carrier family 22 (organic cation transporter), member 4/5
MPLELPGKREMAGVVLNYFYSLGEALVGVIAYLDGDWVNLQYWVSAPPILFVVYYWIVPESARWLLAKNLNLEALEVVKRVAKHNGVTVSERIEFQFRESCVEDEKEPKSDSEKGEKATYMGVIKSKILLPRCLILFFIW